MRKFRTVRVGRGDYKFYIGSERLGHFESTNGYIHYFEIAKKFQRKGYGTACYKEVEKRLRRAGVTKFKLTYADEGAMMFWKSIGFKCLRNTEYNNSQMEKKI